MRRPRSPWPSPATRRSQPLLHLLPCALLPAVLLAGVASAVIPQKPPPVVRNGEVIDLRGTLAVEHRGWQQFLVLRPATQYEVVPDAVTATLPVPHAVVREFGITLAGQNDRIARFSGKIIRVSGRLQFTPGSRSLWNGTLVWATVVALPNGEYLDAKLPEPGLPLAIRRYTATTTLRPGTWARTYTARNLDTRQPLLTPNLAGCNLAGEGDVLNCSCADGFRPTSGTLHTANGNVPAAMVSAFARFLPGAPAGAPITAEVECARNLRP